MSIVAKWLRAAKREKREAEKKHKVLGKPGKLNGAALRGRHDVMSGKRPPLKHAICIVLGDQALDGDQVYDELTERGWLPAGDNPRQYVGGLLSSQKKLFPRVERGLYRRAPNWEKLIGPVPPVRAKKEPLINLDDESIPKCWRVAFMLEANPVLDYDVTARRLYGSADQSAKNRVNALMSTLRYRGIVQATGERTFEVDRKRLAEKFPHVMQEA